MRASLLPDYAISEAVLAELTARLATATDAADRLALLLGLAWHLRQRDSAAAQQRSAEVEALLDSQAALAPYRPQVQARLLLVRGEACWLNGAWAEGERLGAQALLEFEALQDHAGCADAHGLLSWICCEQGQTAQQLAALERMRDCAAGRDALRHQTAQGILAVQRILREPTLAPDRLLLPASAAEGEAPHPGAEHWRAYGQALLHALRGDCGRAVQHFSQAHHGALQTGQIRWAVRHASNVGVSFNQLKDHLASLEWMQLALELAQAQGWPTLEAMAAVQLAATLCALGRHERARDHLEASQALLKRGLGGRDRAIALNTLGKLDLACGAAATALASFHALEQLAKELGHPDLRHEAWMGQARAHLQLGDLLQARKTLDPILAAPNAPDQIEALRLRAEVHARQAQAQPAQAQLRPLARLDLQTALALAGTIEGYRVPPELFEALAREWAEQGDWARAYDFAQQAAAAQHSQTRLGSEQRAIAMEVHHETASTRRASEQQRLQACAEQQRAEALQHSVDTLEQLGAAGRDISAHLESAAIFGALQGQLQRLLGGAQRWRVYGPDPSGQALRLIDEAAASPGRQPGTPWIDLQDPQQPVARCAREGGELNLPGPPATLLCALRVGERLLGVLELYSEAADGLAEADQAICRSLCAHASIALANAEALSELRRAEADLLAREQLAALGQLVANVAHEINTPLAVAKSSIYNIDAALPPTLERLPPLLARLDPEQRARFFRLLEHSHHSGQLLSSREERALNRQLSQRLQAEGIAQPRRVAELLSRLQAGALLDELLPLLRHAELEAILDSTENLATLVGSSASIEAALERVAKVAFALQSYQARPDEPHWQEQDVQTSLDQVLRIYQHQIRQGTELVLHYEAGLRLRCLPDELGQVWTNLIHNALQAMHYRGRLSIRTERVGARQARISISDSGPGVPPALRERIFEPFFTTKPVGEGSGLGLEIVRSIVSRHGGQIELHSPPEGGACFRLTLPALPASRADRGPPT